MRAPLLADPSPQTCEKARAPNGCGRATRGSTVARIRKSSTVALDGLLGELSEIIHLSFNDGLDDIQV